MKKDRIEITKGNNRINFYLVCTGQRIWLFSQEYSMSVYEFFKNGKSVSEIKNCRAWRGNPRLSKTIDRLPTMISYVRKDYEIPYKDGKRRYYRTTYRDLYAI